MVYALIPDSNIINLGNYSRISIYPIEREPHHLF